MTSTHQTIPAFDAFHTPILPGVNLLEASAGTGKTYTLALVVLRSVLEIPLEIDKILVVTYTNAATAELKARIGKLLQDAQRRLQQGDATEEETRGGSSTGGDSLGHYLVRFTQDPRLLAQAQSRLDLALLSLDLMPISTIHGFCQRSLNQYALLSGESFESNLLTETKALQKRAMQEVWRQTFYDPTEPWMDKTQMVVSSLEDLEKLVKSFSQGQLLDIPDSPAAAYAQLDSLRQNLKPLWPELKAKWSERSHNLTAKPKAVYLEYLPQLQAWFAAQETRYLSHKASHLLRESFWKEGYNKNKQTKEPIHFWDEMQPFAGLDDVNLQLILAWKNYLYKTYQTTLAKFKEQEDVWLFDDIIVHLAQALQGPNADLLAQSLRQDYTMALVDEFQDTSPDQWAIFQQVFAPSGGLPQGSKPAYLFLIGDPKQAIYAFRGADVHAYFAAKSQVNHEFSLATNYRSHPRMVEAVNALFAPENSFALKAIDYQRVQPHFQGSDLQFVIQGQDHSGLHIHQGDGSGNIDPLRQKILQTTVAQIIQLLQQGQIRLPQEASLRPVQPRDIAILVHKNDTAIKYQDALRQLGVQAVIQSKQSLFQTDEAQDVYALMDAVLHYASGMHLKRLLHLDWISPDSDVYLSLIGDENRLENWQEILQSVHQAWYNKGVLYALDDFLKRGQQDLPSVYARLVSLPKGERRLTNVRHLLEVLQTWQSQDGLNPHQLLQKLAEAIWNPYNQEEAHTLRLESDAQALKIITLHRSKGLQFPLVFCPDLWEAKAPEAPWVFHDDKKYVVDARSEFMDRPQQKSCAQEQSQQEDRRLIYVGLTRAELATFIHVPQGRDKPHLGIYPLVQRLQDRLPHQEEQAACGILTWQPPETSCGVYRPTTTIEPLSFIPLHLAPRPQRGYTSYSALARASVVEVEQGQEKERQDPSPLGNPLAHTHQEPAPTPLNALPKGAHFGNWLHDLAEQKTFAQLLLWCQATDQDQAWLKSTEDYGFKLSAAQLPLARQIFLNLLTTPLDGQDHQFQLQHLTQVIKEMPYDLYLPQLQLSGLNSFLAQQPDCQPLTLGHDLQGFITGFMDFIGLYQGRYYLMDYKTNSLDSYHPQALASAMQQHNYGLQYWVYTLALHLFLRQRLPGKYQFERDFGGVKYLFVRGMDPAVPGSGVYSAQPTFVQLQAFAQTLGVTL